MEGLLITSGVTLLIANLTDISSMSTMGSAGFLIIFAAVNAANAVLARDTGSRRMVSLLGVALCLAALGALVWQTAISTPGKLWFLVAILGAAFLTEATFRLATRRKLNPSGR
ncbi:hypothetical protein ACFQGA_02865 [Marinobacter koreensis]|uniref:hypothetical protein n=1 Tax=Marinobacter koreensis TaxID=335974 RepID=UPI003622E88B